MQEAALAGRCPRRAGRRRWRQSTLTRGVLAWVDRTDSRAKVRFQQAGRAMRAMALAAALASNKVLSKLALSFNPALGEPERAPRDAARFFLAAAPGARAALSP